MKDSTKNIISNILGLIILVASIVTYIFDKVDLTGLIVLSVLGLGLFLFKVSQTRLFLKKYLNKKM